MMWTETNNENNASNFDLQLYEAQWRICMLKKIRNSIFFIFQYINIIDIIS